MRKLFSSLLAPALIPLTFVGCGQSFRDKLTNTWILQSQTCNGVADSTIANGLNAGASIVVVFEDATYRITSQSASCSHVRQGEYISLPGETGVGLTESGSLGCTPSGCAVSELGLSASGCGSAISSTASPGVSFRESGEDLYLTLSFSGTDCNADSLASDIRVETYKRQTP